MEPKDLCRCCLREGRHRDMNEVYTHLDEKEVYSTMLQECFDMILWKPKKVNSNICESCITLLRTSLQFKKTVLKSEKEFIKLYESLQEDNKPVDIKQESNCDTDYEDYIFQQTDIPSSIAENVKEESREAEQPVKKKRTMKKLTKLDAPPSRVDKIRSLVTRLANSMGNCERQRKGDDVKKKSLKMNGQKLKLTKEITVKPRKKEEVKIIWTSSRHRSEKTKHLDNLRTVLEFSNAVPFKNKSLLGYTCSYCNDEFPDPNVLRTHTEKEHAKDRLTKFLTMKYTVKLDITNLKCNICDDEINNLYLLKEHLAKKHGKTIHTDIKDHILQFKLKKGDVYDCVLCSSTYETFKMLTQHMNKHYNNYVCSKCDTGFANKRSLNAHNITHIEGNFQCGFCEKVFSNKTKKQYHEKLKHFGARNISNCPHCDQPFRSYYQRNQHMIKVHNTEAQYKCNICQKAYLLKSLLMYHVKKNHLMEKNAQCSECGYRFFSKKALKAHMVKHTGERKFRCEVCDKSYARKYTLKEHMRIHNNDRRFKCSVCDLAFVQKCSLKSHLLSNHGISMAAADITSSVT